MAVFDRSVAAGLEREDPALTERRDAGEAAAMAAAPVPVWGAAKKIGFRWLFTYLVLYLLPTYLMLAAYIPHGQVVPTAYTGAWQKSVSWLAERLFHLKVSAVFNGSGDKAYDYLETLSYVLVAALVALAWTLLDRRRPNYARLHEWLRVYVRFGLGMVMLIYGASKVIPTQFSAPSLGRLLEPFGAASPMGLLWTFMGASAAYTIFAGAGEMAGGLLLIARRTTLLGALVCMAVLGNVVMLNFCYDVPVKLYSTHLFLIALFLAAPGLRRLADLLLFNRRVEPANETRLFARKRFHVTALVFRTLFLAGFAVFCLYGTYDSYKTYGAGAPKSPFYGVWNVDEMVTDGKARPPLLTDESRWRRLAFDKAGFVTLQLMDDSRLNYPLKLDAAKKTMELTRYDAPAWKASLSYQRPEPGRLLLAGTFDGHAVRAALHLADPAKRLLTSRGFHWINESPFNR
jgi:hypothetical protein